MTSSGPTSGFAHLGAFLGTRPAFAANFLDEGIEIIAAIVIGDLVPGLDVFDRTNLDRVFHEINFGIRSARMIDIARPVSAVGPVDRPAVVDLEQVPGIEMLGFGGGYLPADVSDDELSLFDRHQRKQAKAGPGAGDPKMSRW